MSSEIADLMAALQEGTMTLDQVAQRFRERSWPRRITPTATTYLERAAATQQDAASYIPGSFDEVAAAHMDSKITDEEYAVLSEAVAESKRAEDQRKGVTPSDSR